MASVERKKNMSIVAVYSGMDNSYIRNVMNVVYNTLHELNVGVEEIDLRGRLPFYEGIKNRESMEIMMKLQNAEAIILATSVNMFAPAALMKNFLEYCANPEYTAIIANKNYMTISVSDTFGERECSQYLYKVISMIEGTELVSVAMGGIEASRISSDITLREILEKNTEDFYRLLKQNRKNFTSSETYLYKNYRQMYNVYPQQSQIYSQPVTSYPQERKIYPQSQEGISKNQQTYQQPHMIYPQNQQPLQKVQPTYPQNQQIYPQTQEGYEQKPLNYSHTNEDSLNNIVDKSKEDFDEIKELLQNIRNKSNSANSGNVTQGINKPQEKKMEAYHAQFEAFEERQQEDINIISQQMGSHNSQEMPINAGYTYNRPLNRNNEVVYREKNCKQMMQSLPHHFQANLAVGIKAVFQFFINGEENIEGYLYIENGETGFIEGVADNADIYIYASTDVMKDILKGVYSSQKAFMTGQLKVRGNFVLLNKLDQLYKKMN